MKKQFALSKKHVIKGLRFISTPLLKNRAVVVRSLKFATEERCNSFWKWDTIRSPLWCAKGGVPAMPGIQELIFILPLFHIDWYFSPVDWLTSNWHRNPDRSYEIRDLNTLRMPHYTVLGLKCLVNKQQQWITDIHFFYLKRRKYTVFWNIKQTFNRRSQPAR